MYLIEEHQHGAILPGSMGTSESVREVWSDQCDIARPELVQIISNKLCPGSGLDEHQLGLLVIMQLIIESGTFIDLCANELPIVLRDMEFDRPHYAILAKS